MKFVNKDGYLEIINRVRTPLVNLKQNLVSNDYDMEKVNKYFEYVEKFLSEISGYDGWEITEDADCWHSAGSPDIKKYSSIEKGIQNSKMENK